MTTKTILITGGAGYIGSHAAKLYSKSGYKVIVLDNLSRGHKEFIQWGEFYLGDIGDKNILEKIFSNHKIDIVSHFAAFALVEESVKEPEKYHLNNVIKAKTLAEHCAKNGVKVFQFSSTCATYGEIKKIPITEDFPQKPINPYGETKLLFEKNLFTLKNQYNMNYSILRYFNAAGASPEGEIGEDHTPESHLIPLVLDVALGKRSHINVFGNNYETRDGTCIRDYIHVCDLASAHVLAAEKVYTSKTSSIYNLGNGEGHSVMEVIQTAQKVTGKKINFNITGKRAGDPPTLIGSSEKLIRELNWKAEFNSLEKIIETAWNWHKKRFLK